jgi:hypothetical protein
MTAYPNQMNPADDAVRNFLKSKPEIGTASFVVVVNEDGVPYGFAADHEFRVVGENEPVPSHWKQLQADDVSWTVYDGSRRCRNRIGGSTYEC